MPLSHIKKAVFFMVALKIFNGQAFSEHENTQQHLLHDQQTVHDGDSQQLTKRLQLQQNHQTEPTKLYENHDLRQQKQSTSSSNEHLVYLLSLFVDESLNVFFDTADKRSLEMMLNCCLSKHPNVSQMQAEKVRFAPDSSLLFYSPRLKFFWAAMLHKIAFENENVLNDILLSVHKFYNAGFKDDVVKSQQSPQKTASSNSIQTQIKTGGDFLDGSVSMKSLAAACFCLARPVSYTDAEDYVEKNTTGTRIEFDNVSNQRSHTEAPLPVYECNEVPSGDDSVQPQAKCRYLWDDIKPEGDPVVNACLIRHGSRLVQLYNDGSSPKRNYGAALLYLGFFLICVNFSLP